MTATPSGAAPHQATSTAPAPRPRSATLATLLPYLFAMLFLTIAMAYLVQQTHKESSYECTDTQHSLPNHWMLAAALAALVAGRVIGRFRYQDTWKDEDTTDRFFGLHRAGKGWHRPKNVDLPAEALGGILFSLLTLAATIGLIYEAVGVQQINLPQLPALAPITQYTRCAVYYDIKGDGGFWTYAVVIAIGLLVGYWLWAWHPSTRFADKPGRASP